MPIHVNIPSGISAASPSVFGKLDWLNDALTVALTRAVTAAKAEVAAKLDELGVEGGITTTHAPLVSWQGPGIAAVDDADRAKTDDRIFAILDDVIAKQSLPAKNRTHFASRRRPGKRSWIVLDPPVSAMLTVADYVGFLEPLSPGPGLRQGLLDVLHEKRWVTVWVVKTRAAITAKTLVDEVTFLMDQKDPAKGDETSTWAWTNSPQLREEIVRLDRTSHASAIPQLTGSPGLIVGSGNDAAILPGALIMVTRMKLPALPQIQFAGSPDAFWEALRSSLLSDDQAVRLNVIPTLIDLRGHWRAYELLQEGLDQGMQGLADIGRTGIRHDILGELAKFAGRPYSIALLILYGVGHPFDVTPQSLFEEWFKQKGGRDCLDFLERVLSTESSGNRAKAAKVLLHLLDFSRTEGAQSYPANVTRLKELTAKHDLFAGGALGIASLRQLIEGQAEILNGQRKNLVDAVSASPSGDSARTRNILELDAMGQALQSIAHDIANLDLTELEAKRRQFSDLISTGEYVLERVDGLHNGIAQIYQFIGKQTATDETNILFELRGDYVSAWASGTGDPEFRKKVEQVDDRGARFDELVADVKWKRAHDDFRQAVTEVHQNRLLTGFGGGKIVKSQVFFDLRKAVKSEMEELRNAFFPKSVSVGAVRFKPGATILGRDVAEPLNLDQAVKVETKVAIFRIHTAMFSHAAVSNMLHEQIMQHEIGNADFRRTQGARLTKIRTQIADDFNNSKFQAFIDRDAEIREIFADVQRKIESEINKALFIEVLITAAAALLTMGTGLLVRAALVGRTVGVLRTARAVETIVFLSDAAVFTGVQLGARKVAFDKEITLSDAATGAIQNLAFLGAFRVLGRLTAPLLEKGAWGFVAVHGINASAMTGIGAAATKVQTGEWPRDIKTFLLHSVGSYVLFMGVSAATRSFLLRKTPLGKTIQSRIQAGADKLLEESAQLNAEYIKAVRNGTISEPQFNRIRTRIRENFTQVRELAKQLRGAGLVAESDFKQFMEAMTALDAFIAAQSFSAPPGFLNSRGHIQALPAPESIAGLVRQGGSNLFTYDADARGRKLASALALYEGAGFVIARQPGGLIHVKRPGGRIAFVLDPAPFGLAPPAQPLALLPPGTTSRQMTLLERSLGKGPLPAEDAAAAARRLGKINRALLETLETEFTDTAALLSLRLFNKQFPQRWTGWNRNAIRGVARMLEPQRGIMFRPVERLFESRTQAELKDLFTRYREIADKPGADLLVSDEISPRSSLELIRIYDDLRIARIRMPPTMTRKAVQGLLRLHRDGRDVVGELRGIEGEKRLARLEAASPLVDPRIRPSGSPEAELLRAQQLDIRPGLNLLSGTPADVRAAIEARGQASGGKLHDLAVKNELEKMVEQYRTRVAQFQAGASVKSNMIGKREEFDTIIAALEQGAEVFSLGNIYSQPGRFPLHIDTRLFPLPGGATLHNAPSRIQIQLDVGAAVSGGRMLIIEATTASISLPRSFEGLDPQSSAGRNFDFNALNPDRPSHQKLIQALKLRSAAHFAHQLGGGTGPLPRMVFRVGRMTPAARRAYESLGFEVIETNPKP